MSKQHFPDWVPVDAYEEACAYVHKIIQNRRSVIFVLPDGTEKPVRNSIVKPEVQAWECGLKYIESVCTDNTNEAMRAWTRINKHPGAALRFLGALAYIPSDCLNCAGESPKQRNKRMRELEQAVVRVQQLVGFAQLDDFMAWQKLCAVALRDTKFEIKGHQHSNDLDEIRSANNIVNVFLDSIETVIRHHKICYPPSLPLIGKPNSASADRTFFVKALTLHFKEDIGTGLPSVVLWAVNLLFPDQPLEDISHLRSLLKERSVTF